MLLDKIVNFKDFSRPSKTEKSLSHVPMVAEFLDDNKPKIRLKSEFALFQT